MSDPLQQSEEALEAERPRQRYLLEDTGFDEVPKKYRKFYRKWKGAGDELAPNEVICPVCKVVIRSSRELRPGDRVYCMPCMSRLVVVRTEQGTLEAHVAY
ncbi:hypothetical protein KF840_03500 [bacterium]|nr:hypothetical protein [bacterium]